MQDRRDFTDAERGFIGRSEQRQITAADGRVVWDPPVPGSTTFTLTGPRSSGW
jgi:alkyl sulfatase BDS1-like metallo-beta-lactamase superfamily hydrolase